MRYLTNLLALASLIVIAIISFRLVVFILAIMLFVSISIAIAEVIYNWIKKLLKKLLNEDNKA